MPFQMYISNYRCHLSFTYGNLDAQKHIFSHRIFIKIPQQKIVEFNPNRLCINFELTRIYIFIAS